MVTDELGYRIRAAGHAHPGTPDMLQVELTSNFPLPLSPFEARQFAALLTVAADQQEAWNTEHAAPRQLGPR